MTLTNTLHLNFRGGARQALEYYQGVFGGDLQVATYGDVPAGQDADQTDQVAWGRLTAASGFQVMAYDVQRALPWHPGENAFYHALHGDDPEEIRAIWQGLLPGATVHADLGPAVFAPLYGKLTDRFGVTWIIDAADA